MKKRSYKNILFLLVFGLGGLCAWHETQTMYYWRSATGTKTPSDYASDIDAKLQELGQIIPIKQISRFYVDIISSRPIRSGDIDSLLRPFADESKGLRQLREQTHTAYTLWLEKNDSEANSALKEVLTSVETLLNKESQWLQKLEDYKKIIVQRRAEFTPNQESNANRIWKEIKKTMETTPIDQLIQSQAVEDKINQNLASLQETIKLPRELEKEQKEHEADRKREIRINSVNIDALQKAKVKLEDEIYTLELELTAQEEIKLANRDRIEKALIDKIGKVKSDIKKSNENIEKINAEINKYKNKISFLRAQSTFETALMPLFEERFTMLTDNDTKKTILTLRSNLEKLTKNINNFNKDNFSQNKKAFTELLLSDDEKQALKQLNEEKALKRTQEKFAQSERIQQALTKDLQQATLKKEMADEDYGVGIEDDASALLTEQQRELQELKDKQVEEQEKLSVLQKAQQTNIQELKDKTQAIQKLRDTIQLIDKAIQEITQRNSESEKYFDPNEWLIYKQDSDQYIKDLEDIKEVLDRIITNKNNFNSEQLQAESEFNSLYTEALEQIAKNRLNLAQLQKGRYARALSTKDNEQITELLKRNKDDTDTIKSQRSFSGLEKFFRDLNTRTGQVSKLLSRYEASTKSASQRGIFDRLQGYADTVGGGASDLGAGFKSGLQSVKETALPYAKILGFVAATGIITPALYSYFFRAPQIQFAPWWLEILSARRPPLPSSLPIGQ